MEYPPLFLRRIETLLGAKEFSQFQATLSQPPHEAIRIQPSAKSHLKPYLKKPVPWNDLGFYAESSGLSGNHPYHHAGAFYFQEPSAMAVVPLLEVQPDDVILDLAAAPGGKTTDIGHRLGQHGLLIANDIDPKRAQALMFNVERMGLSQVVVTQHDPHHLPSLFPHYFDKILIDAPCSGEGMFRNEESAIQAWSLPHVQQCAVRQEALLEDAVLLLREGGRMVYSTCTFSPEENEDLIERFLIRHPEFTLMNHPLFTLFDQVTTQGVGAKLWPHQIEGEGHYVVVIQHRGKPSPRPAFSHRMKNPLPKNWLEFVKTTLSTETINPNFILDDRLFMIPKRYAYHAALHTLRAGIYVGEIERNYFYPSHHFAHCLRHHQVQRIIDFNPEDPQLFQYLKGEELPVNLGDGWALVTVDQLSLGWGKVSQGRLKNHYPKGLRLTNR